jgi:F-type H+-transporting ATPase subunit alpha
MTLTLWAVNKGAYEDVPVKNALAFEAAFLAYVRANHADVLKAIDAKGDLSADNEKILASAMQSFKAGFSYN